MKTASMAYGPAVCGLVLVNIITSAKKQNNVKIEKIFLNILISIIQNKAPRTHSFQ
jgi:hypothetical protein